MPRAYFISRHPVPASIFNVFDNALIGFSEKERRFVFHIFASCRIQHRNDGLPIPCQVIDSEFGSRFSTKKLERAELIDVSEYSHEEHRCRRYRLHHSLLDRITAASPSSIAEATKENLVDLFSGKPYARRPLPYTDDAGFQSPKWVRDAAESIRSCTFDGDALDRHLAELKSAAAEAPAEKKDEAERRERNDVTCARLVQAGAKSLGSGLYQYAPEYRVAYTGRISEIGGGLQSGSRRMKLAAFARVPNIHNYDLKAAQAYVLLQELEDAQLEHEWLRQYLSDPDAAAVHASAIGVTRDTFKTCLYAVIMGAPLSMFRDAEHNSLYGAVLDEVRDPRVAIKLLPKVHEALRPLKACIDPWHTHLLTSPMCRQLVPNAGRKRWLRNACDMKFCPGDAPKEKRSRKAAAFVLQGQEAAYIHRLTLLAPEHGFIPISNQHDGLVTIGAIPEVACERAASLSGFRYAKLVEKPDFGVPVSQTAAT